jgi:hypothetical protein
MKKGMVAAAMTVVTHSGLRYPVTAASQIPRTIPGKIKALRPQRRTQWYNSWKRRGGHRKPLRPQLLVKVLESAVDIPVGGELDGGGEQKIPLN